MSRHINPNSNCYKAAIYCRDHKATDEEAAKLFGIKPSTVQTIRGWLKIKKTGSNRSETGSAIALAKEYMKSELGLKEFVSIKKSNRGSIVSALSRMGHHVIKDKPNRRIMVNHGSYYFRLRTKNLVVYQTLCSDIDKARLMRDKLERKYKA
jgi:hypothetical protein